VNPLVTPADVTRVELAANRRRFQREGVAAYRGPADARVALPITSRFTITVRPGWRASERHETPLEAFSAWAFERAVPWVLYPTAAVFTIWVLAIAVWRAFSHQ